VNFLSEVGLDETDLHYSSEEGVEFVHDAVNLLRAELHVHFFRDILDEVLSRAELRLVLRQKADIYSLLLNCICELLKTSFRPPLRAPQEFSLVLFLEDCDRFVKFYLSRSQRVDLHELLEVEESLRNGKLIRTSGSRQEVLELGPVWKLKNNVVDFSQWVGIHILQVLSLKNRLQEQFPHFLNHCALKRHLRLNSLN